MSNAAMRDQDADIPMEQHTCDECGKLSPFPKQCSICFEKTADHAQENARADEGDQRVKGEMEDAAMAAGGPT